MRKIVSKIKTIKRPPLEVRKPVANRRARPGGQQILDVKVRKEKARSTRNRWILIVSARLLLVLGVVFGVAYGVHLAVQKWFWTNPEFALRQIDVEIAGEIPREQILQSSQLEAGQNLFTLDLGALERRILAIPQVENVKIHRMLPDTIRLEVIERRPVAWLAGAFGESDPFTAEQAYLVDAGGTVLRQKASKPEHFRLPVIYGCDLTTVVSGQKTGQENVLHALALIADAADLMIDTDFRIQSLDISRGYCIVARDDKRREIWFSPQNYATQFQKLRLILAYSVTINYEIATVNLLPERNTPVTFASNAVLESVVDLNETDLEEGKKPTSPATPKKSSGGNEEIRRATPVKRS